MTQINSLRGQIADLNERFTPEYSKVKSAQAQLAALQASFEHDRTAVIDRIKNDYLEATRKETLLASAYAAQTKEVAGQGEKAVQYNILKRDVDSSGQLYYNMLQQMKESSVASALHASNVRVSDPARLPVKPAWPSFRTMGALGMFAGFFGSLALILFRDRNDRTLQQPGDVQFWTHLLELGSIPKLSFIKRAGAYNRYYDSPKSLNGSSGSGKSKSLPLEHAQTVDLITWKQGASVVSEAFRSVLTSVLFAGENGSAPHLLVLTSAGPGDGKTTVVSNLAIAMAEIGRWTLIIDADMRRPRMHDLFRLPNDTGLSDILKIKVLTLTDIDALIQETDIPGLHVLTSGPPTQAAANLLYSPNLAGLLSKCKDEFDMVFVDTPPMLQMTDARVVGRLADAVILVARAEQTTRDAIIAAQQRFAEDRVRVLGTVLNDWDPKTSRNGHYGYYRGSSYYNGYQKN